MKQSGDTDMESIMERYYADFSLLVTQNCLEAMMANREPYKYDERAEKNQERITVKEINFKEYDAAKGVYSFSVLLEGQSGMETKTYLGSYMETEG